MADHEGATSSVLELGEIEENSIHCELYTLPQLASHAHALASSHQIEHKNRGNKLLLRLRENERVLEHTYKLISAAAVRKDAVSPASEWLLDNFYLIEKQIYTIRRHLPRRYNRELPRLLAGRLAGYPRVYAIAYELISHVDGKVDAENIKVFVSAYQRVADLLLGELWAIPIMLRLAIVESLRNVAIRIAHGQIDRNRAMKWAQRFAQSAEVKTTDTILTLADMSRSNVQLSSTFVAELSRQLQEREQNFTLVYSWIEQRLQEQGTSREELVHEENQRLASDQISIGNCIEGLRVLDSIDWREFVDVSSSVERALLSDPAGAYAKMDFATRDRYRHVVEKLARRTKADEAGVALKAVDCARNKLNIPGEDFKKHVGYYLVDSGIEELEKSLSKRPLAAERMKRGLRRKSLFIYCGFIAAVTAAACWLAPGDWWTMPRGVLIFLVGTLAISMSQLAVALANWLATHLSPPTHLPRLDFSQRIPPEFKTVVAVPCMLSSPHGIGQLIEKLEIRYLGNRHENIALALLSDFKDADRESMPEDTELLDCAAAGIEALNRKYAEGKQSAFYLFHRPRKWNAQEKRWIGYERKRGKLAEFNQFLLRGTSAAFMKIAGDTSPLKDTQFVITLDADTQLPAGSAQKLIGTLAHPLNRPVFDPAKGRVTRGYSVLQPTVAITLHCAHRSWYSRLFGGECGIDPYTQLVSDVYQDLFGEGSFIGKGIYDLKGFDRALAGVLPENRILSHDLLEGSYTRCGLATDIHIFEDFPSRYLADTSRRHRWTRGDWQIASWLFSKVPGMDGAFAHNPISPASKWKIFDNLRRSLVPICLLLALAGGWFVVPRSVAWTLYLCMIPFIPHFLNIVSGILRIDAAAPCRHQLARILERTGKELVRTVINITFLPYEAWIAADAVIRTMWRLLITGRKLLEWKTSSETEQAVESSLLHTAQAMWFAPVLSVGIIVAAGFLRPDALAPAGVFLMLWMFSPYLALRISIPLKKEKIGLSPTDWAFLRMTARQTWAFFTRFVNAEEHWLPPDNFQEEPVGIIAHRTSPTNIGMSLLANLAASDLGYISVRELIERCRATLDTMQSMERYRGHFYNWYDTESLKPLQPFYISTVDSGNLAGHLFTLQRGLLELGDQPFISPHILDGLADALEAMNQQWSRVKMTDRARVMTAAIAGFKRKVEATSQSRAPIVRTLKEIRESCSKVRMEAPLPEPNGVDWSKELVDQIDRWLEALAHLSDDATVSLYATLRDVANGKGLDSQRDAERIYQAQKAIRDAEDLAQVCERLASKMDFAFLYIPAKRLFSIGYSVNNHRLDNSCYDLLASEARLASFVAISLGQVDQEHWFALGRQMTGNANSATLVSWSGSMFEYLMPLLVMPSYEGTLLDQTYEGAVRQQIAYGNKRGVPWGISESCYNLTDARLNYQYRAFGVPGLGLQRGLGEDLVVAPYATIMALMVNPVAACRNLFRLAADQRNGAMGFYEAVDYTPSRLARNQKSITIRSYMAHHQGMSLLALNYVLREKPMQRRFSKEPIFKVADLLLHERVPRAMAAILPHPVDVTQTPTKSVETEHALRIVTDPSTPNPEVHLLSNGRYHVMVNAAGSGSSRWKDLAVTRWREDAALDGFGLFCYIRDVDSGDVWSNTYQPACVRPEAYETIFSEGRIEFRRRNFGIDVHTEISVSAEDDVEIRRMHITNNSNTVRTLELTSYGEVVIAEPAADAAHPAFSNLFVQTQFDASRESIVCVRRPRSAGITAPAMFHSMWARSHKGGSPDFETNRSTFIGRNRTLREPHALREGSLSGESGPVLDPIVSIRRVIRLESRESTTVDLIYGMAETAEQSKVMIDKYRDQHLADRVYDLAWTHAQIALRQLNCSEIDAQLYCKLAGSIVYASHHRRASGSVIAKNRRGQAGLWAFGISGDLPILMLRISDGANIEMVRQCVQAHAFWRAKGLIVDLVITNDDPSVYRQALYDQIMGLIAASAHAPLLDKPGGIFVRRGEQTSEEDRTLLQTVARIVLHDSDGTFREQVDKRMRAEVVMPALRPRVRRSLHADTVAAPGAKELSHFNGTGGFSADGREYVMVLDKNRTTPAPWVNVLANPTFGSLISESGGAYTWLENCHEYRLTPWSNDPVSDTTGEALYIRDEDSGAYWSPQPMPARGPSSYIVRHGFGYTTFETSVDSIASELQVYVAMDAPMKFMRLKLTNRTGSRRNLSVWGYFEWVLGDLRARSLMHVHTDVDARSGAILARNPYSADFSTRIAFVSSTMRPGSFTGDRMEFIGRNGSLKNPQALGRLRLSNKVGPGLDPCAGLQLFVSLAPGESREVVLELGIGQDIFDVQNLLGRFGHLGGAKSALDATQDFWKETLSEVSVETPDSKVDLLANGWLLYQTLACRMWARTGFYQSGGAFGFRDQLQDSLALLHSHPALTRQHLLTCAQHQFRQGDVQHWWHVPSGRGVRTHISDDYLWLPFVACQYARGTGDAAIFDEVQPYVDGRPVNADEESYYDMPLKSEESGTLYEHCVRAIEHGLRFGEHGLPLMGCGDWNDGMNRVGAKGKGESVWLAFFLYDVLTQFERVARNRGDAAFADRCKNQAQMLQQNIEAHAWDGDWYRRAYFDDGRPLGSATSPECQIDSLPQSWSVISAAGDVERSRRALEEVNARLVKRGEKLIQLFDPPFNKSDLDPGYIKGYLPGVRENGGQYTHAALWAIMAFAKQGRHQTAWELLSMLNPINHSLTPKETEQYKVEPYVVAADVYGVAPHVGRGGWTWYTGSAGWMYRVIVESLLGLRVENDVISLKPCIPSEWNTFKIHYRFWDTQYEFQIERDDSVTDTVFIENGKESRASLRLVNSGVKHAVRVCFNANDHDTSLVANTALARGANPA